MIKIRAKNTINKFIFWDFDIFTNFLFHHKCNGARLLSTEATIVHHK